MQLLDHPDGVCYLTSFDPDYGDGRGHIAVTSYVSRARRFADAVEGWQEWRRESTVQPLRPDGLPNRPLTAYTVSFFDPDATAV